MIEELDAVAQTLKISGEYGLECEVIAFALKAMKYNPELTIIEALECGLGEWIK